MHIIVDRSKILGWVADRLGGFFTQGRGISKLLIFFFKLQVRSLYVCQA